MLVVCFFVIVFVILWCWGVFFDVECFVALAVDSFVVDCFEFESFTYLDQHEIVVCIILIMVFFLNLSVLLEVVSGQIDWFCCFMLPDSS